MRHLPDGWITRKTAMEILEVGPTTMWKIVRQGLLRPFGNGYTYRFYREDVEALAQARTEQAQKRREEPAVSSAQDTP